MNRREFLLAAAAVPLAEFLPIAALAESGVTAAPDVISAARLLTAKASLPEEVIARASTFQAELDPGFSARLAALTASIAKIGSADREAVIAALSEDEAKTAIQLISPLYLGYTGQPSGVKAIDNAKFVTFLDAIMYDVTADNLIRPSYARGGPNYWSAVPNGVTAPPMDPDIEAWGEKSPKAATSYATPDPRYHLMCQGKAKTLAEAEALLAANSDATISGDQK